MPVYYDQNFDSLTIGSHYTTAGFTGTIVAPGVDPSTVAAFKSDVIFGGIGVLLPHATTLSVFMSYKIARGSNIFNLVWQDPTLHDVIIVTLLAEQDGSLSVFGRSDYFSQGVNVANSMVQNGRAWTPGEWVFIHCTFSIDNTLTITATVKVNEQVVLTGTRSGYSVGTGFDSWQYVGPFTTVVDNITLQDVDTLPHPAPEVPPNSGLFPSMYGRLDQLPFEHVDRPDDAPVRLDQGVIELTNRPDNAPIFLDQAVIELIQKNTYLNLLTLRAGYLIVPEDGVSNDLIC